MTRPETLIVLNVFAGASSRQTDFVELANVYLPVAASFKAALVIVPTAGVAPRDMPAHVALRAVGGGMDSPLVYLWGAVRAAREAGAGTQAWIWAQDPLLCGVAALIIRRLTGARVVVDLHNDFWKGWSGGGVVARAVTGWVASLVLQRADRVRAVSEALADRARSHGVRRDDIAVIPCPVDLERFDPARAAPDPDMAGRRKAGSILALAPGALTPRKGQQHLVAAAAELRGRHPGLRLVLVGDGPSRRGLQRAVRRRSLGDVVSFLGRRPHADMPALMAACDLVVLASHDEGAPRVVAEAMAMKRLVVATPASAAIAQDGRNAIVAAEGPAGIAAAIDRALNLDAAGRGRLTAAGRRTVLAGFSRSNVIPRLVAELFT